MTTLHDFGGALGRPLDTFFWALTISWSRAALGSEVWNYVKIKSKKEEEGGIIENLISV
jgi:hypothetical protein